jgi:hypothetical protein
MRGYPQPENVPVSEFFQILSRIGSLIVSRRLCDDRLKEISGLTEIRRSLRGEGRYMALVISPLGIVSNLSEYRVDEATWNEGCIHIRRRAQSVIVSVDFDRLTGPAIAAALYEIADMRPKKICLSQRERITGEVLIGFGPAFQRICKVFATSLSKGSAQTYSDRPAASDADFFHADISREDNETDSHAK